MNEYFDCNNCIYQAKEVRVYTYSTHEEQPYVYCSITNSTSRPITCDCYKSVKEDDKA